MRTLYLPPDLYDAPDAERLLDEAVQDVLRIGPGTRNFTLMSLLARERERVRSLLEMADVRPWLADVRQVGVVESGEARTETTADDLITGAPDYYDLVELRRYEAPVVVDPDSGQVVTPGTVDQVVELSDGLLIQTGRHLHLWRDGVSSPYEALRYGQYLPPGPFALVSTGPDRFTLLERDEGEVEVDPVLEGLEVVIGAPGRYRITLRYLKALHTSSYGVDLGDGRWLIPSSTLQDYETVGGAIDDQGKPLGTQQDAAGVVLSGPGALICVRRVEVEVTSGRDEKELRVSFAGHASDMYRYPSRGDVSMVRLFSEVARWRAYWGETISVERDGIVGDVSLGYNLRSCLPGRHHVLVAGSDRIALVDLLRKRVLVEQLLRGVVGLTWSTDGALAAVVYEDDAYVIYQLREVRNRSHQGWRALR